MSLISKSARVLANHTEIVGAVSGSEKPHSKREPVQNPKLRHFKRFEF
jgi:hypothetical protein